MCIRDRAADSHYINILVATPRTTFTVPKIASIYTFAPGEHTQGDGWLYQNRAYWDTFVMPNGVDGKVDSIYADVDTLSLIHIWSFVSNLPGVGFNSVVHCKDCGYYETGEDNLPYCRHPDSGRSEHPQPDDFCSYGKRKWGDDKNEI